MAPAPPRLRYLDELKVVMIAGIIAIHGVLGYTDTGWWSYGDAREVTLTTATTAVLMAVVGPLGLVVIPLLFLVAGLLTAPALERKGPRRFAVDRLGRLGVPFVVYVLLVQPPVVYAVDHRWGNASGSYREELLGSDGQPDTGPLWFVGTLLVYSLVYAAWVAGHRADRRGPGRPVDRRVLLAAAAGVVLPTFLLRVAWPLGSESPADLNLWEWPACVTLFGTGVLAARQGWTTRVPADLQRECRALTLAAAAGLLVVAGAVVGPLGLDGDVLLGGWHGAALAFVACESVVAVCGAVWLLGLAQGRSGATGPSPGRLGELARASYGAFVVQTPVLLGAAVVLRPLDLPAEVKAVLVAGVSVPVAFLLAAAGMSAARRTVGRCRPRSRGPTAPAPR